MCGIAGIISTDIEEYQRQLDSMICALSHRGPDGSGRHFFKRCALGHTRLSIVDLETGGQPMLTPDKQLGITFNGEIYGFRDIKARISGYPFHTSSDTEVILALFRRYGEDMMPHLPGMFAFAIWDEARQRLFCARDRFGEKPFFYAFGKKGEFLFASEIKAILATGLIYPIVSRKAIAYYLRHLYVSPYETAYENVYVLPPAHSLTFIDGHLKIERYWNLPNADNNIDMPEAVERFKYLFDKAVNNYLVADVPVGAFLSGGLDSSTIVAAASRYKADLKTYSFGFEGGISELPYAREAANRFNTDHIELTEDKVDIRELLIKMQEVYDEPFADSSNIPTYLICKLARQYGKVVLTGDGGDELLAGYSYWYNNLYLMEHERKAGFWHYAVLSMAAKVLKKMRNRMIGQYYRRKYGTVSNAHKTQKRYFSDVEMDYLMIVNGQEVSYADTAFDKTDTVDDALRMDILDYMPGDILAKTDRASMANGLELRSPFLDVDFASFCISLPSCLKLDAYNNKLILRKAYSDAWPDSVRTRGKQGFGAPVTQWLKQESVHALKQKYLNNPKNKVFEIISFDNSRRTVNKDDYKTWILLVLSLWMERHEFAFGTDGSYA